MPDTLLKGDAMFFTLFYCVSVVVSFKLGAQLVHHPEAPLVWAQRFAKWLKQ